MVDGSLQSQRFCWLTEVVESRIRCAVKTNKIREGDTSCTKATSKRNRTIVHVDLTFHGRGTVIHATRRGESNVNVLGKLRTGTASGCPSEHAGTKRRGIDVGQWDQGMDSSPLCFEEGGRRNPRPLQKATEDVRRVDYKRERAHQWGDLNCGRTGDVKIGFNRCEVDDV